MGFLKRIKAFFTGSKSNDYGEKITNSYIDSEAISSLSLASVKLDSNLGLKSTGRCGICVKSMDTETFNDMKQYVDNFLNVAVDKKNIGFDISFHSLIDNYGYLWFILKGKTIEELVASITAIGDAIHEKGFSRQLLATVFEFTSGSKVDSEFANINNNYYLIYNNKLDKFYPFVPIEITFEGDKRKRNHEIEAKIMKEISNDIKFEKDMSLWYPIWNIPFNENKF